jgi:SRSO17 transposase
MLARTFAASVPCAWVVGDSVYGSDYRLRRLVEQHGRGYVLTVTSSQRLGLKTVADWLEDLPAKAWRRLSAGDGAKGPRLYDWAWLPYAGAQEGWQKGLLIRRKLGQPDQFTFYLTLAPGPVRLPQLVRVAGTRWTVEACFEAAKGEVGLDQYEVRSWAGWHRHVTLAMLAHAYLAILRRRAAIGGWGDGQPGQGPPAADRARDPQAALAPGLGAAARSTARPRLVALAPPPPAARQTRALATANPPI